MNEMIMNNPDLARFCNEQQQNDGTANLNAHYDSSTFLEGMDDEDPENVPGHEREESWGTGSFTTNTFNARLAGSHGMQILRYI